MRRLAREVAFKATMLYAPYAGWWLTSALASWLT